MNTVSYQHGKGDQFYYKYSYDADNRVTGAYSSRDKLVWIEDATYRYYLHGPLARTEIGRYKVQGVDYAYTLQGWLKGINSDSLSHYYDMAADGWQNTDYARVSRDVYSFKIGYYNNDFTPISSTANAFNAKAYTAPGSLEASGNQLFNGNISFTTLGLKKIGSAATTGYTYGYDQLNRLTEMRQHTTGTTSGWSNSNIITAYRESVAYDANGNILKYLRKGTAATPHMDSLSYKYTRDGSLNLVNNRLTQVKDSIPSGYYKVDIDNQSSNNYLYDRIGNLRKDVAENIDSIRWTVYGKIRRVKKPESSVDPGFSVDYGYDASGQRTWKKTYDGITTNQTFYVRDAQGNVLAVYTRQNNNTLKWAEQHLYGSSRLGMWTVDTTIPSSPPVVTGSPIQDSILLGSRNYELTNHLGNVLAVISDKKIGNDSSGVVNYYIAEVLSQNDYYPFGMLMPGRAYSAGSQYRYGFNGKENDNEVKGTGNQQDYGMRIYDVRVAKFLSNDPIASNFPWNSPYAFSEGDPINNIDLDGLQQARPGRGRRGANPQTAREIELEREREWREQVNERANREEARRVQHNQRMTNDPVYRDTYIRNSIFIHNLERGSYWRESFNSAEIVFSGGGVTQNKMIGDKWDGYVRETVLANPNCIGIAKQISLKVTGTINGQLTVAKIRIDNIVILKSGKSVSFDLKESKFSIEEISVNNVLQTLTPQQRAASNIFINGKNIQVQIRGAGSAANLTAASNGMIFNKDQNITAQINSIAIVAPQAPVINSKIANIRAAISTAAVLGSVTGQKPLK